MPTSETPAITPVTPSKNGDTLWFDLSAPTRCVTAYFTSQTVSLQPNLESALLLNVLPAMHQNQRLTLTQPVSATLIKNLEAFSKVFYHLASGLSSAPIDCATPLKPGRRGRDG